MFYYPYDSKGQGISSYDTITDLKMSKIILANGNSLTGSDYRNSYDSQEIKVFLKISLFYHYSIAR